MEGFKMRKFDDSRVQEAQGRKQKLLDKEQEKQNELMRKIEDMV